MNRPAWAPIIKDALLKLPRGLHPLKEITRIAGQERLLVVPKLPRTWVSIVRYTLQVHCAESRAYQRLRHGKPPLFCGDGRGMWGLRGEHWPSAPSQRIWVETPEDGYWRDPAGSASVRGVASEKTLTEAAFLAEYAAACNAEDQRVGIRVSLYLKD